MIEVNNISKSFDGKVILHNVSAKFYSGKTNLIIGQSGSGKTVLMKCIVGLMQPDKGQVIYDGRDITSMSASQIKELRNEIGMLFRFRDGIGQCHVSAKNVHTRHLCRL